MTTIPPARALDPAEQRYLRALGKRVRIARMTAELSQAQLAERSRMSRNFVSSVERGAHGVEVLRLLRIAAALGVPVTELLPPARDEPRRPWPPRWFGTASFVAESVAVRQSPPHLPHDLVAALDLAPLATVEAFLSELRARAGEDIPAAELWTMWQRMTSA